MIPHDAWHMAEMGLSVSVAAPALIHYLRRRTDLRWLSWPAALALPFFILLHAAITVAMARTEPPLIVHGMLHLAVFVGAIIFWLPVLGSRHRLDDGLRCGYLFLAAPALDLAAVWVVATGESAAGLSMIVAMLPIGIAAVALTWRWITEEEREVAAAERLSPLP